MTRVIKRNHLKKKKCGEDKRRGEKEG